MLPLDDPLWFKLDDAHRTDDIPAILVALARNWDDEAANSLFWDDLCHQDTCYGATYAAVPHLLRIAEPDANAHQRLEIALFLGHVACCAFQPGGCCGGKPEQVLPQGLPRTAEAWDRKLDVYRSLLARLEREPSLAAYERDEAARYRQLLAIGPVGEADLGKIDAIATDFFDALPEVARLCARALAENAADADAHGHLLGGIAAANRYGTLAWLLGCGEEGSVFCPGCGAWNEFARFGDRIAIYAVDRAAAAVGSRRSFLDYKDGAPSRCDGFIQPLPPGAEPADGPVRALLDLAARLPDPTAGFLLRHFLGRFTCPACGATHPVAAAGG